MVKQKNLRKILTKRRFANSMMDRINPGTAARCNYYTAARPVLSITESKRRETNGTGKGQAYPC
jgi:hypothetical protein